MTDTEKQECVGSLISAGVEALMAQAHKHTLAAGFCGNPDCRNQAELIALVHSELSEALEALRYRNPPDDKIPEFSGCEAELADAVIRICDLAAGQGYRLAEAIVAKLKFNSTREFKHGKQF